MKTPTAFLALALLVALGACASVPTSSPDAIATLEQQQRANPASAPVNRALGIAYHQAGRDAEARRALETAQRLDPADGTTLLYLGLAAEAMNDLPAAKRAYASYLQFGRTSRVRSQLQGRLAALARKEIALDAKAAVAQESTLGAQGGSPTTVAVMPLRFSGRDTTLQPLERGFADLLITDLARSPQLTLVERSRMQALLDEISLGERGVTDASTSARAGRLLRAGRVVQGALLQVPATNGDLVLRADAAVVDVPTSRIQGTAQGAEVLDQVFALEKKLVLDLFQQLGVTLTVAQRNEIEQRPTRSLAAFLSYSRGLASEDAGRFDDANRYFNEAVRLDPGFGAAQQKSAESKNLSAAATPATVEASIKGSAEERVAVAAADGKAVVAGSDAGITGTVASVADGLNTSAAGAATSGAGTSGRTPTPPGVDKFGQGTNSENGSTAGRVLITLKRPGTP
jgi:tetratricopeptide (TPR) repeat protein